ncbi:hypothetical protein [Aestuariivirga sp.]|uniref:hypothetical protein n=1 Tax=Aestuariivirga sp. TaxID=2650926 RepID=UPI003BAB51E0
MSDFRAVPAFKHVLRATFGHIGPAFQMSWPWMALIAAIQAVDLFFFADMPPSSDPEFWTQITPGLVLTGFLILLVSTFGFASIAVNWHRYILLGEAAEGGQKFRMDRLVWRYLGNIMLLQLGMLAANLVAVAVLVIAYLILSQAMPQYAAGSILGFVFIAWLVWLFLAFTRYSTKLPAIARGREDYSFGRAWEDTRGHSGALFGFWSLLLLLLLAVGLVLLIPALGIRYGLGLTNQTGLFLSNGLQFVVNWVLMILGVTMLTTQYGIFAEGREV